MVKTLGPGYSKWTFYKSVTGTGSSGNPLKFGDKVIIYNYKKDPHKNTWWLDTCSKNKKCGSGSRYAITITNDTERKQGGTYAGVGQWKITSPTKALGSAVNSNDTILLQNMHVKDTPEDGLYLLACGDPVDATNAEGAKNGLSTSIKATADNYWKITLVK